MILIHGACKAKMDLDNVQSESAHNGQAMKSKLFPWTENMVNSIHCLLIVSMRNVTHFTCRSYFAICCLRDRTPWD